MAMLNNQRVIYSITNPHLAGRLVATAVALRCEQRAAPPAFRGGPGAAHRPAPGRFAG